MTSITSISSTYDNTFPPDRRAEALQHFIAQGKKYAVEKLITSYGAPLNAPLPNGELPLHFAVKTNQLEIVEVLLKHGFDAEKDPNGIELHSCDPESKDSFGLTAIDHAIHMGHREIAALLISRKIGKTFEELKTTSPFYAADGDIKLMDMSLQRATHIDPKILSLLKNEEETTKIDPKVMSPFSVAAYKGDLKAIEDLYEENPNLIRTTDKSGRCPVHYAILGNSTAALKLIKKLGIKLTLDTEGHSLLHYAAFVKNPDMVNAILESESRLINHPNASGHTPLHYAAMQQDLATFAALINNGADPKLQDSCYETPFSILFAKSLQKDPLALSHGQILLFFTSLLSLASGNPLLREWLSRDVLDTAFVVGQAAGFGADFLTSFRLKDSAWKQVLGTLSFTLLHLLLPSLNPADESNLQPHMLKDPVQHFAHLLLCAYQIGVTCIVAKGAFDGLKNCWRDNFRPLTAFRNTIVHTVTTVFSVQRLIKTLTLEAARFSSLNPCPSHTPEQITQMKTQSLGDRILRADVDLTCDNHLSEIFKGLEQSTPEEIKNNIYKLKMDPKLLSLSEGNDLKKIFRQLKLIFHDDQYKKGNNYYRYVAHTDDGGKTGATNPVYAKISDAYDRLFPK